MKHLAFDLGGSGGKLFEGEYDGEKIMLREIHRFSNAPLRKDGKIFWDFPRFLSELKTGLSKAAMSGEKCTLGIDAFCNDFALLDSDGKMLCPVRSYRDLRTEHCRETIYGRISPETLYGKTGNQIAPFNTFMQLAAMRIQGDGKLLDEADRFLFVPDLLKHCLGGNDACEYTLMSVSQLYNQCAGDFDDEILSSFCIRREMFPPVALPGTSGGYISDKTKNELGTGDIEIIHVCGHDTGSAFLGATEPDSIILSSGTWSIVGTEVPEPVINKYGFLNNFANEGGYPGHQRLLHNVMGTWILQEMKKELENCGNDISFEDMIGLASEAEPLKYLVDVDDSDFYSPDSMTEVLRGKIRKTYGDSVDDTGVLVRCVCESLAAKYRIYISGLEKLTGKAFGCINIIGGGSRNEMLNQMTADASGKTVVAGPVEATALGNIMVQMIACGEISGVEEGRAAIKRSFPGKIYYPENTDLWNEFLNNVIM